MCRTDAGDGGLESVREGLGIGFELFPSLLELAVSSRIEALPVIIDNKTRNFDAATCKSIDCGENLLFRQLLPKGVPCACSLMSEVGTRSLKVGLQ
jgi:hypothetical protein